MGAVKADIMTTGAVAEMSYYGLQGIAGLIDDRWHKGCRTCPHNGAHDNFAPLRVIAHGTRGLVIDLYDFIADHDTGDGSQLGVSESELIPYSDIAPHVKRQAAALRALAGMVENMG